MRIVSGIKWEYVLTHAWMRLMWRDPVPMQECHDWGRRGYIFHQRHRCEHRVGVRRGAARAYRCAVECCTAAPRLHRCNRWPELVSCGLWLYIMSCFVDSSLFSHTARVCTHTHFLTRLHTHAHTHVHERAHVQHSDMHQRTCVCVSIFLKYKSVSTQAPQVCVLDHHVFNHEWRTLLKVRLVQWETANASILKAKPITHMPLGATAKQKAGSLRLVPITQLFGVEMWHMRQSFQRVCISCRTLLCDRLRKAHGWWALL